MFFIFGTQNIYGSTRRHAKQISKHTVAQKTILFADGKTNMEAHGGTPTKKWKQIMKQTMKAMTNNENHEKH